ncbi:MAG: HPr family phosphocarrier protein [Candidatus Limnocylindria bacterium]
MPDIALEVRNPSGLHARPAALFIETARAFEADVQVTNLTRKPEKAASARSLLAVLALGVSRGHMIRIAADGVDAHEAITALRELVESGMGESPEPDVAA